LLLLLAGASTAALALAIVAPPAAHEDRAGAGQPPKPSVESAPTSVRTPSAQPTDLAAARGSEQTSVANDDGPAAAPVPPRARMRNERLAKPAAAPGVGAGANKESLPSVRTLLDEAASAFVLGQTPRARSIYQQILDRQPMHADAWRGLCLTASRMGQRKDAERAFERYVTLRPTAPDAARIRAQLDKLR
jgi:hypothetical protein